ncbi:MAG: hypothetical protein AMXMBFR84_03380 [Candidatus Hydrogenedentota bacterium]
MSLAGIRDQEVALKLLHNVLRTRRVPNGFLFLGPPGVGKFTTAMELAKALCCAAGQEDACDACLACRKVEHGNHPDVTVIRPREKTRLIKTKAVEEINSFAALRPMEAPRRVFIIEDADRMNDTAQNKFLKTLEEPPGKCVFILVSSYAKSLLPTIRSRCQMVRFGTLREETVQALLTRMRDVNEGDAATLAAISGGQMTRAIDLVDTDKRSIVLTLTESLAAGADPVLLAEEFAGRLAGMRKQHEADVNASLKSDDLDDYDKEEVDRIKEDRMAVLNALVQRDILEYLYLIATWYRDIGILSATGDMSRVWNRDQISRLEREGSPRVAEKIAAIERTRRYLDRYINEERVFRDLFFQLAAN